MNTNTNSNNTTTASPTTSSGVGGKVKGAAEFVHGAAENLRGTFLGAVDTLGNKGPTENDEIARQGRLEMERGLAKIRGSRAPQVGSSDMGAPTAGNASNGSGPEGVPADQGAGYIGDNKQPQGYGVGDQKAFNGEHGSEPTNPSHHRDDAISGLPHEGQAPNQQSQNAGSQYDPSQADYRDQSTHPDAMKKAPTDQNGGLTTSGYDQTTHNDVNPVN